MLRTDVLLDQLGEDREDAAAWVGAEWVSAHVEAASEAMMQVRRVQVSFSSSASSSSTSSPSRNVVNVVSAVTVLLEALELVAASHVATRDTLRAALEDTDGNAAIVAVLEHGVEVLEALSLSSPRKRRKVVDGICEHVEEVIEELESTHQKLWMCAPSELESVVECLCEVQELRVGEAGVEYVGAVEAALGALSRCLDPVIDSPVPGSASTAHERSHLAVENSVLVSPLVVGALAAAAAATLASRR